MKEAPFRLATQAFARVHGELVCAALATSADFFYGGTTGGIAAAFDLGLFAEGTEAAAIR